MFSKALWLKHFKQGRFAIWGLFLAGLLTPLKFYSVEQRYIEYMEAGQFHSYWIHLDFFSNSMLFQILFTIILASLLIGMQRSNQHMDFLYSLPFKRRDIFLNQWFLGLAVIASSLAVSSLLSLIIHLNSEFIIAEISPIVLLNYFTFTLLNLLAMYTFCLMVGMFTGSIISHLGLSFIGLLLPAGLYFLLNSFVRAHFSFGTFPYSKWHYVGEISQVISLPMSLLSHSYRIVESTKNHYFWDLSQFNIYAIPLVLSIYLAIGLLSFAIAYRFSNRSRAEHHGKLLLYSGLEPVLKIGVVVCFFLLGGMFFEGLGSRDSLTSYYIGGFVIAGISYIVLRMLLNTRFQFGKQG